MLVTVNFTWTVTNSALQHTLWTKTYRLQSECLFIQRRKNLPSWDYDEMWRKAGLMKVSQKQQSDSNGIYVRSH